ncbi:Hypothetical predicted protein [Mytilus galloprovincialis]|uniref:Uncharacterized protein n=2 Tax=Mytilus galloprovincialis TaxID=29158 RepID=A0A8B6GUT2_MYTGA|nr:Hypothetical predicted protein [Mytilus galloprovincialis]
MNMEPEYSIEPENCENAFEIPNIFPCRGGCCGQKPEEYCCNESLQLNLAIFSMCSTIVFLLFAVWAWKRCILIWCGDKKGFTSQNIDLVSRRECGTAIPCTHIGCSSIVPSPGVHFTRTKRTTNGASNKMNKKLYDQTKNFTECPPSYDEAIRFQSNQISQ